jgi:hypothetical protein
MITSHVSYAIKFSVACAEVSHVADDNDENTVFWVSWLCLSQMGNGSVSGTAESLQWALKFIS